MDTAPSIDATLAADEHDAEPDAAARRPASVRRHKWLKPAVYVILAALVFYVAGKHLLATFKLIDWQSVHLSPLPIIAAVICIFCVRLLNGVSVEMLLRSLSSGVGLRWSITSMFVAAAGRYIPGVSAASLIVMLTRRGPRLPVVLAAMFLSNALMIVIAAAMVAPLLLTREARDKVPYAWVGALVLVGVGLVCLNIRFFVYLCNIALARFKGRPLTREPLRRPYYANVFMLVVRSAVLGLAWWLTARGMDPQVGIAHFPFIASCGILATVAGFLVVFVPAGLGVQEVIITITVAPILGPEAGLLAVLFRLLQTFTDLLTASLGLIMLRRGVIHLPAKNEPEDGQTLGSTALAPPPAARSQSDGVSAVSDGGRRHAPRAGRLPNFFIVGAAKCGTTSLYAYLKQHPQVFMPVHKEPLHFARDLEVPDVWCVRDDHKYAQLFAHAAGAQRVGESSVWYIYSKTAAREIKAACPDARIIVMFRDPVDMLYSLHGQHLWNCNEDIVDFQEALAAEDDRRAGRRIPPEAHMPASLLYSEVGKFAEQLKRYHDVFGRENVHVILFDDFVKDTPGEYRKVLEFLDIDPDFEADFAVENAAKPIPMRLNRFLARHHRLRAAVRRIAGTRLLMRLNYMLPYVTKTLERPNKIDPALRAALIPRFKDDIEELGRMLGRDLSHWCDVSRGKKPAAVS